MRRLIYVVPMALFLALATYFALALRPDNDPQLLPSALIDKPAPDFDLAALAGGANLERSGLAGHVVLINFFASWCVPCREEHPLLMRLAGDEHVALYGIAYKDNPEDSQRLLAQLGDPYRRVGIDREGRVGIDFGVYGVPETYVIDKAGQIRKRFVGPLSADTIKNELLPLIDKLEHS
jgi:cytochrome c biogenesis protein CcmG/thiol:disulfide interchange protein DsbE